MFCQKVWVFWLNLRLVINESEPVYCFVSKEKINSRISHASSYRLTKIWTVKLMFLLQRHKMPELNPRERGTAMSRKAAGRGSQLCFHILHRSLWGKLSSFLICIHATNEKMNQRGCPVPRRLEQPINLLSLCLLSSFFFFFFHRDCKQNSRANYNIFLWYGHFITLFSTKPMSSFKT